MTPWQRFKHLLHYFGCDVSRFHPRSHPIARKQWLLSRYGIDLVFDVGANVGQFASGLRANGYRSRIVSFEPLSEAFDALKTISSPDSRWEAYRVALGDRDGEISINVSENSVSSSILGILPSHETYAPKSRFVASETVPLRQLDSLFDELVHEEHHIFLKLDVQGYESAVLRGAENSLARIHTVQLELSLTELYEEEMPYYTICEGMAERGFRPVALDQAYADPQSHELLQVDAIFHKA